MNEESKIENLGSFDLCEKLNQIAKEFYEREKKADLYFTFHPVRDKSWIKISRMEDERKDLFKWFLMKGQGFNSNFGAELEAVYIHHRAGDEIIEIAGFKKYTPSWNGYIILKN